MGTIISQLNYANAILAGLPEMDISKLQHIQNIVAKMMLSDQTHE